MQIEVLIMIEKQKLIDTYLDAIELKDTLLAVEEKIDAALMLKPLIKMMQISSMSSTN